MAQPIEPMDSSSSNVDYGAVAGSDSDPYDPHAIQQAIWNITRERLKPGQHVPQAQLVLVMSYMGLYGQQKVGCDAQEQQNINNYQGYISQINNAIHDADADSKTARTNGTQEFINAVSTLKNKFDADSFYNLPANSGMKAQIDSVLTALEKIGGPAGGNALEQLWSAYNGTTPGMSASGGSDPEGINNLTSNVGMLGTQLGGLSKSMMATTQADTSMVTTEQDTLNNLMKKLYSLYILILGQMKTQ